MDSIPLALRPLVERLENAGISHQDLVSVLFVVRLGDNLHRAFYATFLNLSLVNQLCEKLSIEGLTLEIEVSRTRWNFRQGIVSVVHQLDSDYDMESVHVLSKIGRTVLEGKMTPKEGLRLIRDHDNLISKKRAKRIESLYRDFPGRALVIPLMAATCATVYFGGTWTDLWFAALCGVAAALVAWCAVQSEQIRGIADYVAAMFVAMVSIASVTAFPDSSCFSAQVLGTLYWFFYGTAYVISVYEICNNQLLTGVARLASAIIKTYGLALGVALGMWFAAWDEDRYDAVSATCDTKSDQIDDLWFILLFPLSAVACLMQFRVRVNHFVGCLIVQTIAYGSQYLIGTVWKQPDFFASFAPAYFATIASHVWVLLTYNLRVSNLEVKDSYFSKKIDGEQATVALNAVEEGQTTHIQKGLHSPDGGPDGSIPSLNNSDNISYLDTGWAKANAAGGYTRADNLAFACSDIWFCLLPALYLLVPGSKLFQTAFSDVLSDIDESLADPTKFSSLGSSLVTIGLGQAVGLRLAFATLWACRKVIDWMSCSCCRKVIGDRRS